MMKGEQIITAKDNKTLLAIRWLNSLTSSCIWFIVISFSLISFILCSLFDLMSVFSALGAFIVCLGLFITAGVTIPVELDDIQKELNQKIGISNHVAPEEGKSILVKINDVLMLTLKEREKQLTGLEVSIVGTIIWAVGGFIPPVLHNICT